MTKKQIKPTVEIAVCAYNEQANVKALLKSIEKQKEDKYRLSRILFVSDGSTDNTVQIAKEAKIRKIQIIDYKKREGKSKRLNEIFKNLESDILVLFDADVVLASIGTIANLIKPLTGNKVGLIGGNPRPLAAKSIIEKGVNSSFRVFDKFRQMGKGAFSCDGRVLALSKKFAKSVTVPNEMIANDAFLYFCALTKGVKFKHVRKAIVYFRSPQTVKDQIRQNTRFIAAHARMEKIFGQIVPQEYKIPRFFYLKETLLEFAKNPLACASLFFVNLYCRVKARLQEPQMDALWKMAKTTKILR